MSTLPELPAPRRSVDLPAAIFVAIYFAGVIALGALVKSPNSWCYLGVILFPAIMAAVWGLPSVVRNRTSGIVAVLYLVVAPLLAAIFMGLPGAFIVYQTAQIFGR